MLFLALRNTDKEVIPVCENEETRNIIINSILYMNDYKYRNLYRTTTQQYNPIENYDRMEEGSITDSMTKTGTEQRNGTLSNTRSNNKNHTNTKAGIEKQKTTNNLKNTESLGQEKSTTENGVTRLGAKSVLVKSKADKFTSITSVATGKLPGNSGVLLST